MDVSDNKFIQQCDVQVVEKDQSIDCIINNAVILLNREDAIETVGIEEIQASMKINVYGPVLVT